MDNSRRAFMRKSGKLMVGAAAASSYWPKSFGSNDIRVGLVGCGGRGTGAAYNAAQVGAHIKIVAMGDVFSDRLEKRAEIPHPDRFLIFPVHCRPQ